MTEEEIKQKVCSLRCACGDSLTEGAMCVNCVHISTLNNSPEEIKAKDYFRSFRVEIGESYTDALMRRFPNGVKLIR